MSEVSQIKESVDGFVRIIRMRPAFDLRDPDPKKNYGIGSCCFWFYLQGPLGVVQFMMSTNWFLPHNIEEMKAEGQWFDKYGLGNKSLPEGWDVGYHSPRPHYEGQIQMSDCEFIEGGKCYYDGSALRASEEKWVETLVSKGLDGIWTKLEEEYKHRFHYDDETAHPK